MPINVCIVEPQGHPAPRALERLLPPLGDLTLRTTAAVPDALDATDVLVLNNIPSQPGSIPEDRVLQFVQRGGGLFCIHDTVFPYGSQPNLIAACGVAAAHGATQMVQVNERTVQRTILLASSDPNNPMERFPIRPAPEAIGHPILEGIEEFDLAEEAWAQNQGTGAHCLLNADIGDRLPAHPRFLRPIPVRGYKTCGNGRSAFFSLGHNEATYSDPNVLRLTANAIKWVAKQTHENKYSHDLFLSYAANDAITAYQIRDHAQGLQLRVFVAGLDLQGGDVWSEGIRKALTTSRELAVLMTPASLNSQWVATEWGSAWVLQKRIVPIILQVAPAQLPERLKQHEVVDFHNFRTYLDQLKTRCAL
jgi:hypothetical protein